MQALLFTIVIAASLHAAGTDSYATGDMQFKDWGISFTVPAQLQRWTSEKENAFFAYVQKSANKATIKTDLIHVAIWSAEEDAAMMCLTVKRERGGDSLNLSKLLARLELDNKLAKKYGHATKINRLALDKIGSLSCIINDVTLRTGARQFSYHLVTGVVNFEIQWMFPDGSKFAELKPLIDGIFKTISIDVE